MKTSKKLVDQDRLITLFFIFVLATACFWLHFFIKWSGSLAYMMLQQATFYFGFLGHAAVILVISIHYLAPMIGWLKKDRQKIILTVAIFLGLMYSSVDGLKEYSWLVFVKDLAMSGLLILGLSCVQKLFSKNEQKN